MIAAALVCPSAPLLVPQLAGPSDDLAQVRHICERAMRWLVQHELDHIVVLAQLDDSAAASFWGGDAGVSVAGFGVDHRFGGYCDDAPAEFAVGAWLLDRIGWRCSRAFAAGPVEPRGRTGIVVLADGSAKRSGSAPGDYDSRAHDFDASISDALRTGDRGFLDSIDRDVAAQLWSNAASPLSELARISAGYDIEPALLYDDAPFGVGYWVATWDLNPVKPGAGLE